ncbi:MAG: hypothetical protein HZA02_09225 [Nitrospinae bacterium]|nr:hypothetical protein [Nitrospinota bacterium]
MNQTIGFEEGKPCPVKIQGYGGGLSFSANGDMLLIGAFPGPTDEQIKAWGGKWRAKLATESEFPAIPIFAVGSENWIVEAPCNPADQEREAPGFAEALYAKDEYEMTAILVDSTTGIVRKIAAVPLNEMFIERLVLSWNPFRHPADQYTKSFAAREFTGKIGEIFKTRTARQLWDSSW